MMDQSVMILSERPMVKHYLLSLTRELNWVKSSYMDYYGDHDGGKSYCNGSIKIPNNRKIFLIDYQMAPGGLAILENFQKHNSYFPILCLFENLTVHNGVKALKTGAQGVIGLNEEPDLVKEAMTRVSQGKTFYNDAIGYRLEDRDFEINPHKYRALTPRQKETLYLIEQRLSNKEIGYALNLSLKTVERHKKDIADKFGLESPRDIYDYALREGYFDGLARPAKEETCTYSVRNGEDTAAASMETPCFLS